RAGSACGRAKRGRAASDQAPDCGTRYRTSCGRYRTPEPPATAPPPTPETPHQLWQVALLRESERAQLAQWRGRRTVVSGVSCAALRLRSSSAHLPRSPRCTVSPAKDGRESLELTL